MTNNLAKIAKDLRAFAKRCKNVHYSDSLLISFILSGILSLASISFSDTFDNLSDSQKEAAMDSINEMRQQINYARKDNDKLIKGSSLELVKLMEQGDQVVKSPWGSQQFGFGYTYNSWGTSFKGRGGKQNDIKYRRTNDLTKYVYDPNLHEYGATNLHIKRNKEPDALTINPANVHEPYRPYTPERLDSINVPNAPTFNPNIQTSRSVLNIPEYRSGGDSRSYSLGVAASGTNRKTWGNDMTFDIDGSTTFSAFDGLHSETQNNNQRNHNSTSNDLMGATATNRATLWNGRSKGSFTNVQDYAGLSYYSYWWRPVVDWSSGVQYENLATGGIQPTGGVDAGWTKGVGQDDTPRTNDSSLTLSTGTGYDQVEASRRWYGWAGWTNWSGWTHESFAEQMKQNAINDPSRPMSGTSTTYAAINNGGSAYSSLSTSGNQYTDNTISLSLPASWSSLISGSTGSGASAVSDGYKYVRFTVNGTNYDRRYTNDSNGSKQYADDVAYYTALNFSIQHYNSFNHDWEGIASGGAVARRDELVWTNQASTMKYLDVNIGNTDSLKGGSFLKATAGANVTVNDVDVSIYNGGGAAYVIGSGPTGTVQLNFADSASSIANFKTTNDVVADDSTKDHTNDNIAFNIQESSGRETSTVTSDVSITGPVDIRFKGDNNIVYNNISAIGKLTIQDGTGTAGTYGDTLHGWNNQSGGRIFTIGDKNVVYNGEGAVLDSGSALDLGDVQMQGSNGIMVALKGPGYGDRGTGVTGLFMGDIKLQGAFGGTGTSNNDKMIAIYAASGQNNALNSNSFMTGPVYNMDNIKVSKFLVGFDKTVTNGISIYSINGSNVEVGASNTHNITDGIHGYVSSTPNRDYENIELIDVSTGHVMGYARGATSDIWTPLGNAQNITQNSTITFKKDIDLMSKDAYMFIAENSGQIVADNVNVRAAGSNAVIAYATGKKGEGYAPSTIKIDGKVVAADYLTLGSDNTKIAYSMNNTAENNRTYNNIAAYADDSGVVEIEGGTAATDVQETHSLGNSLIYGIGAIAKNNGVVKLKKVSIVDNEKGALFAENDGKIEFEGNIVNENNINASGNITEDSAGTVTGTRHAKALTYGSSNNDHETTTPFYVNRPARNPNSASDTANITFTGTTNLDMYDGILLTGNRYNGNGTGGQNRISAGDSQAREFDYAKEDIQSNATNQSAWALAKYRGMKNVTAKILSDRVTVGLINQASDEIEWDANKNGTGTTGYLKGIGTYAGGMTIQNRDKHKFDSTLINSNLKIKEDVNIEDQETTKTTTATPIKNDPFNYIKMESDFVTIDTGKKVTGNAADRVLKGYNGIDDNYQVANVGLSMANSLWRWHDEKDVNSNWEKTSKEKSGFMNKGVVDITGGNATKNSYVTGLLANFGTISNGDGTNKGYVSVDRGNAIVATDGSVIRNLKDSEISVSGKYTAPSTPAQGGNSYNISSDTVPSGENYGIVGISDGYANYNYSDLNTGTGVDNAITIKHENAKIFVEGTQATGIFALNKGGTDANAQKVSIEFTNDTAGSTGIDVRNNDVTDVNAKGIGIALVNTNTNYANGSSKDGGVIKLKGDDNSTLGLFAGNGSAGTGALGTTTLSLNKNDIATGKNGIGIYAESADITLDSKKFTVETKDNGVGLWATDDSNIGIGANHQKTFQYNYNGANDKNGFAMAFTGRNVQNTIAQNDLDIKFTNVADKADVNLVNEANTTRKGTNKGIAGILVNTDGANDVVNNYGNIEEDKSSVTNLRAYGAVVNKGTFVNYGDIKLNDSLMPNQASDVTSADMKKVNVGIFANRENGLATTIENHGDITIGKDANSDKNIGSWAIYGYNIKTGAKPDGTDSVITINRNSYGIYSGDGNVDIQKTKLKVGNDKVLGHVMHTWTDDAGTVHNIDRQNGNYAQSKDLLSGLDKPRELDNAIGIYIDKGASNTPRKLNLSADMDIDRFSYGIVLAEKNGGAQTDVTIGTPTDAPTIRLAYSTNNNLGGHVKSTAPTKVPKVIADEVLEQGNAVYYYSADNNSRATSYANVTMDGDYNTAYYTKGSVANYGTIDLRSKYDVDNHNVDLGYGNVGIFSANPDLPSVNYGTITTSMSDTGNMRYSAAMAAGRNYYVNTLNTTTGKYENKYDRTEEQGYIVNEGNIVVKENAGIGMFATGSRSRAINKGTIKLEGEESIGMYLDHGAIGENYGTITGNQRNLKGVVAINGGYIKNYGTINVTGTGSNGIVTDGSKFIVDANGNPTEILLSTDSRYNTSAATTAVQNNGGNGGKDLYGGSESSLEEGTSGNPKTTGVGTTITMPDVAPLTTISVDGVNTPIFTVDTNAPAASVANPNGWGDKISITSSIQTGGTRIIDLSELDGWGNKMWNNYQTDQLSEVTSVGMYVDTSGVRYTNPINGLNNLSKLAKVNLYFGPEATQYTNAKAIRLGNQLIKPFNDALNNLPGGAVVNPLSASLTWQVAAKLDDNNQLTDVYMSKVPYHSFAFDDDTSLVNFTNNLDNVYEIVDLHTNEKEIFNKLNSLGNGEGHILAQAFDQMRAHIYGGIQQRTVATEKIFDSQVSGVMSSNGMVGNPSKDSTKYKAFGERGEYKTDTKGIPDYENYAGGFVAVHEGESIYKGEKHGWYTGVVDNNFSFKDIARSHENQAMIKGGLFKTTPFDVNGEFTWTIAGEGYFGRTDTNRRFWVVDKQYDAEAHYYTYGVALKNELAKSFRLSEGFAIKPHVGIDLEYGRYSSFHEDGTMSLDVKGNDYHSIKPNLGVDFTYKQPVFKKSMFVASLGLGYEKELGRVNDVTNEARIQGAWTDYFSIRGDKENKKGNYKADLNLGIDNGRLGFTVNAGYDSTGKNFRGGAGLRFIF